MSCTCWWPSKKMGKFVPSHTPKYWRIKYCSTSFSSFKYRENVCHGSILHACTAYCTRVHARCDAVHVVVLALCVCHACLVHVSCEWHACGMWHACNACGLFKLWVICTVHSYVLLVTYMPTYVHTYVPAVQFILASSSCAQS